MSNGLEKNWGLGGLGGVRMFDEEERGMVFQKDRVAPRRHGEWEGEFVSLT